jgi:hypothetical protein
MQKRPVFSILLAWLTAATMDIAAASIQYYTKTGKGPAGIFRYISRALIGDEAKKGGFAVEALGLALHYLVALLFTLFFFWIFPMFRIMQKNLVLTGLFYGIFVWAVMNRIVLPLSQLPDIPFDWKKAGIACAILMFCIGLPISIVIGNYYRKNNLVD